MHTDLEPNRFQDEPRTSALARRLRELPAEERPPYDWNEFLRRAQARAAPARRARHRGYAAAAAAFVAVVIGAALMGRLASRSVAPDGFTGSNTLSASSSYFAPKDDEQLTALVAAAERWLASLPQEPAVVRVDTRLAVTGLEDRIAWMDERITAERMAGAPPERLEALERERARLVQSLVQVRYAETLAAGLQ
ncbi:MAG: hypothetical protein DIU56_013345 [Pseudomonadota bacterium]|jgi:hypothetical protein|nr:MAG: hypothetical protein DIU56_12325 [Pseudomonadota bacterium]